MTTAAGYVLVRLPGHHLADTRGYVYEHRLVAEASIGRRLEPGEKVHHRNGKKDDNRPENLEVVPSERAHRERHRSSASTRRRHGEPNEIVGCACGCGILIERFAESGRRRRFVSGHNRRRRP